MGDVILLLLSQARAPWGHRIDEISAPVAV